MSSDDSIYKTIIFDIDGTIANCEHRQPFVRFKPKNWNAFNKAMKYDTPHHDIIWLLKTLKNGGNKIIICTGRTEDYRKETQDWIDNVAGLKGYYEKIYMREEKDYRDDGIVKIEMLKKIKEDGFDDPTMVFDDRDRVVKAWREAGLRCFQVAPGDF